MRPCIAGVEPRVISWVTSSPSLAKKPLSTATQIGRLVAPAKVTIVSLVWAMAGVAALKAHPIAAQAKTFKSAFPPIILLLLFFFGPSLEAGKDHSLMQSAAL